MEICSAHAPHSGNKAKERTQFWCFLGNFLPEHVVQFMFIEANARVGSQDAPRAGSSGPSQQPDAQGD
eukprot:3085219-Pyramimonas_sp.AAC.1